MQRGSSLGWASGVLLALLVSGCIASTANGEGTVSSKGSPSSIPHQGSVALDASFGTSGKVTTSLSSGTDGINALAVQPDGKVVAVGGEDASHEFAIARYNADGTLDTTFGEAGKVTTDFTKDDDVANAVAIEPDGSIVVAGYAGQAGTAANGSAASDFALARYKPDGSLDTTFGDGGKVTTSFTPGTDFANGVVIQAGGKIVAAGAAGDGSGNEDFALVRYRADGTLDPSFGVGGKVTTDFGGRDGGHALAVQADGKIVVAGVTFGQEGSGSAVSWAIARCDADGTLDPTFGKGGEVVTGLSGVAAAFKVEVQADGKLLVSGGSDFDGTPKFTMVRYEPNGRLDGSFGTDGSITSRLLDPFASIGVEHDGGILAAGGSFTLVRFNPNGSLDTTFGNDGEFATDFGSGFASTGAGTLLLLGDGDLLVGGSASVSRTDSDFALARYILG